MTKGEAIKIIEYTFLNADGHLKPLDFDYEGEKGIVEALRMAIEVLSQPSLPSNLNKVAEDRVSENGRFEITPFEKMRIEDIMFGAEWMANQGISADEIIFEHDGKKYISHHGLPDDYNTGDDVIIQIRKK